MSRTRLLLVVLVLALAVLGVLGSAAPASAYCDPTYYEITGRCDNTCTVVARAVGRIIPVYCPM